MRCGTSQFCIVSPLSKTYNDRMSCLHIALAASVPSAAASSSDRISFFQLLLTKEGLALWLILLASAVAIVVFIERFLHCHRSQINSAEFLNGVRNVLRRNNIVEAISICDATPGPVARLARSWRRSSPRTVASGR